MSERHDGKPAKYPGYTAVLPPRVRYDDKVPPAGKLLYAEITAMTDVTGYCWASNSYLSALIGVSKGRASRLIGILASRGYLEITVIKTEAGAVAERRIYVTDLGLMRLPPPVRTGDGGMVKNDYTPMVKNDYTPMVKNNHTPHIEKNDLSIERNPPYSPPQGTRRAEGRKKYTPPHKDKADWMPEDFERLWKWYPTGELPRPAPRGNRQRAIRAWDRLQPSPELMGVIAESLARQAASDQWQAGIGVPHLSTYLNGYGWEGALDDG